MELSKPEPANALPADSALATLGRSRRGGTAQAVRAGGETRKRRRSPRCGCGRCAQCADNARWERIFAEKFADPDYYTSRNTRGSSPLESL